MNLTAAEESLGFVGCWLGSKREASVSYVTPRLKEENE